MSKMLMSDTLVLDGVRRTKDGYLACDARVARVGIQKYKGHELGRPDLGDVMVYRSPEEVFHRDALRSMAHRPVTLTHPPEVVDAKNWKKYARGQTGDEVLRDGDHVRIPMVLMDAEAINAVEDGTRELSMGYSTELKWTPGVTEDGQKYDAVQTEIRANHLAVVPTARGGKTLKIGDSDKKCRSCGAACDTNDAFCKDCGATLTKDADIANKCPQCGADMDADEDTCDTCGASTKMKDAGWDESKHPRDKGGLWAVLSGNVAASPAQHKMAARMHGLAAKSTREGIGPLGAEIPGGPNEESASAHEAAAAAHKVAEEATAKDPLSKQESAAANKLSLKANQIAFSKDADVRDRDFSEEERKKLAESGAAMPGGGFPIKTVEDLHNAIKAIGRAKDPAAAKKHIISRAKALGATKELPESWATGDSKQTKDAAKGGNMKGKTTMATVVIDGVNVEVADDLSSALITAKIKNLSDEIEAQKAEVVKKQAAVDAASGEIAVLKKQVADAVITPEKLDVLVNERSSVITAAATLVDARTFEFSGKSLEDIRRASVAVKLGDAAVKEMSDASIEGAFKALTVDAPKGGTRALAENLSKPGTQTKYQDTRDAAYATNLDYLNNAWKGNRAAN